MVDFDKLINDLKLRYLSKGVGADEVEGKLVELTRRAFEEFLKESYENMPEEMKSGFDDMLGFDGDKPVSYDPGLVSKFAGTKMLNGKTIKEVFEDKLEKIFREELAK